MSDAGDLGRRIAERRRELGLTSEEVAWRAGMDASYLEFLENNPSPEITRSALLRLSAALETTGQLLTGAGKLAPPGRSIPSSRQTIEDLDPESSAALIEPGGIGRVVFSAPRGPTALPVNFRVLDGDVIFRTSSSASLIGAAKDGQISFEVDHIDDALTEGWSVLISGEAHLISEPDEVSLAKATGVTPWAGGEKDVYFCLVPTEITGRRIRHL